MTNIYYTTRQLISHISVHVRFAASELLQYLNGVERADPLSGGRETGNTDQVSTFSQS